MKHQGQTTSETISTISRLSIGFSFGGGCYGVYSLIPLASTLM